MPQPTAAVSGSKCHDSSRVRAAVHRAVHRAVTGGSPIMITAVRAIAFPNAHANVNVHVDSDKACLIFGHICTQLLFFWVLGVPYITCFVFASFVSGALLSVMIAWARTVNEGRRLDPASRICFKILFLLFTGLLMTHGLMFLDDKCSWKSEDEMCLDVLGVERAKLGILIGHTQVAIVVIKMKNV